MPSTCGTHNSLSKTTPWVSTPYGPKAHGHYVAELSYHLFHGFEIPNCGMLAVRFPTDPNVAARRVALLLGDAYMEGRIKLPSHGWGTSKVDLTPNCLPLVP